MAVKRKRKQLRPSSVYCRAIWIAANGPIPSDENGNPFDIHHKDRNPFNNELDNLQALSMADHYNLHAHQGDTRAAWAIAIRMKIPAAERKAASDARKGQSHSWGWKISLGLKGKKLSETHRRNLSESHKGHRPLDETRAKMSAARKGLVVSEETRRKRSAALKGRVFSPETIERMRQAALGKKRWPNGRSAEDVAKIRSGHAARSARLQAEKLQGILS